jgi:hypothetical protein
LSTGGSFTKREKTDWPETHKGHRTGLDAAVVHQFLDGGNQLRNAVGVRLRIHMQRADPEAHEFNAPGLQGDKFTQLDAAGSDIKGENALT